MSISLVAGARVVKRTLKEVCLAVSAPDKGSVNVVGDASKADRDILWIS